MHLSNVEQEEIKQEIMHKQAQMFRRSRQKMTVYDFESVRIIGKGAFGEVRLVRRIATGEILALKKIDKNEMIYKNQLRHVKAERDVLVSANNP